MLRQAKLAELAISSASDPNITPKPEGDPQQEGFANKADDVAINCLSQSSCIVDGNEKKQPVFIKKVCFIHIISKSHLNVDLNNFLIIIV